MDCESPRRPTKNIMFVGSTGNGKSSTCNTLSQLNPGPFIIGRDELSCTDSLQEHLRADLGLRIIDSPGFNDNRMHEKRISQLLQQIILKIADPSGRSTNNIDAFVLVCKLTPRPQTLKTDLQRMKELFGTVSLKSTILLVIYDSNTACDKSGFLGKLKGMTEIVRILKEAKGEEPNEGWFCIWDNLRPIAGQEEELLHKVERVEPYTYRKYLESEREMKVLIDKRTQEEMEREIKILSERHAEDTALKAQEIRELEERYAREKAELLRSVDEAQNEVKRFLAAVSRMSEENKAQIEEFFRQARLENERNEARTREFLKENQEARREELRAVMEQNQRAVDEQSQRLTQMLDSMNNDASDGNEVFDGLFKVIIDAGTELVRGVASKFTSGALSKIEGKCNIF